MNKFLEINLNIDFSNEDKDKLNTIEDYGLRKKVIANQNNINIVNPSKITNRELLKNIKNQGLKLEDLIKEVKDVSDEVKSLLKTNTRYIEGIEVLENKMQEFKVTEINDQINEEDFFKLIEKASKKIISGVIPLKIVNKKIENLIKENDLNISNFIEESKTKIIPFLLLLEPTQFKVSINYIYKNVFLGFPKDLITTDRFKDHNPEEMLKKLAEEIYNYKDNNGTYLLTELKRKFLVQGMTGYESISLLNLTSKKELLKKKHN